MPTRRSQKGNIIIRGKRPQRYGMFREDVLQPDGTFKRVRRCVLLGPVSEVSQRAAWKRLQPYLDRVNATAKIPAKTGVTLKAFAEEWCASVAVSLKGSTTRAAESHLRAHILPKLGSLALTEINTKAVQSFVAYLATGRSKKTVENVLLTLSSILRTARAWDYACGNFALKVLALRVSDIDLTQKIVRVRQNVDAATRTVQAVKSIASSADVPMPSQLERRLRLHLQAHDGKTDLLFVNKRGRAFSANKLREKVLHPLLERLGIPRGGFHALRHGVTSALIADGATPAVVQKQMRHSDARITLGVYAHSIGSQQRDAVETRSARIEQFAGA